MNIGLGKNCKGLYRVVYVFVCTHMRDWK